MAEQDLSPTREPAWTQQELARNPHSAADKAARVERMFTAIAKRYDLNNRLHSLGRDQAWRRKTVALAQVESHEGVLDAACGTGDLALLFRNSNVGKVVGVDFTEAMLEIAREKARSQPAGGRGVAAALEFVRADVTALPFEDAAFDVVTIAFGLRNVDRPEQALREFRRVLRPASGRLLVLEFSQPRHWLSRAINQFYCGRIMPLTASWIAGDRSGAYRYLPKSIDTFPDGEVLEQMVRDAGFARTERHPLTFGVCAITIGRR